MPSDLVDKLSLTPGMMRLLEAAVRARLNIISDVLQKIPYKQPARKKVTLPKRQKPDGYKEPDYPFKYVAERF